jgi:hypothetical protein
LPNMKLIFIISMHLFLLFSLGAQTRLHQSPWQQQVDCHIAVQLDSVAKSLDAFIQLDYLNNSPDTLHAIWMHIWPNAYRNTQTAFARQQLRHGETDFYFSKQKGSVDGFSFESEGKSLQWSAHPEHIDIIQVHLQQPLLPGKRIRITTPFVVRLPLIVSRGGFMGDFFSVTQWYPKPAVYDANGWNVMPYLDQGEFYSEFGNYTVEISVPKPFVVASTGHVIQKNDTLLKGSVSGVKYIFEESNIHDFAWFAAKDFKVSSRKIPIGSDSVLLQVYTSGVFKEEKAHEPMYYLDQAMREYSERVGNYPYKTCTVVIGPLKAGSGMEYPTITVCSSGDGTTIMHEVGHNWFYGMLASNERQYPWMDESVNTFYEQWISGEAKPGPAFFGLIGNVQWLTSYQNHLAFLFSARQGISQPVASSSTDLTGLNYGAIIYAKGPSLFAYLKQQLGDSLFSTCMKNYFNEWKFRHPLPGDMQRSFEQSSGMDLRWFFNDLLKENNEVDIARTRHGFKVKGSEALDSFLHKRDFSYANPYGLLPETNYTNNVRHKKLLSLAFPFRLPRYNAVTQINFCPALGFNYYDRYHVGALLFNRSLIRKKLEYTFMPAYAFNTDKLVGYGRLNALAFPSGPHIYKMEYGLEGHSFGNMVLGSQNQYFRINPYIKFFFRHKGKLDEMMDKQLSLNFYRTGLTKDYFSYLDTNNIRIDNPIPGSYFSDYVRVSYLIENKNPVNNYLVKLSAEYGENYKVSPGANTYLKTWINSSYKVAYAPKNKYFKTELFAGIFLSKKGSTDNRRFFLSGNNGYTDYLYDEAMLGRNESPGGNNILGRQLINNNGNMRNLLPTVSSDKWMLALNNEVSLPGFIPLRIYLDLGYYQSTTNVSGTLIYNPAELYTTAGVLLPMFKDKLEIFVPFYQSKQFNYNLVKRDFVNTIGFKLHLNKLDPFRMIDNYKIF